MGIAAQVSLGADRAVPIIALSRIMDTAHGLVRPPTGELIQYVGACQEIEQVTT